jgi:hypothetical protein
LDKTFAIGEEQIQKQEQEQAFAEFVQEAGEDGIADPNELMTRVQAGEDPRAIVREVSETRETQALQATVDKRWAAVFPQMEELIQQMPAGPEKDQLEVDLQGYQMYGSMRKKTDPGRALVEMQRFVAGRGYGGQEASDPYAGVGHQELMQGVRPGAFEPRAFSRLRERDPKAADKAMRGVGKTRPEDTAELRPFSKLDDEQKGEFYELMRRAALEPNATDENLRNFVKTLGVDLASLSDKDLKGIFGD